MVSQLIKFLHFVEAKEFNPYSQVLTSGPFSDPNETSLHPPTVLSLRSVLILSSQSFSSYIGGYAGGMLNSTTHITALNRVLVVQFDVKTILLLYHDSVIPFMSRQYHSFYVTTVSLRNGSFLLSWCISLQFFSWWVGFWLSSRNYRSVLLEVSWENYSFRMHCWSESPPFILVTCC